MMRMEIFLIAIFVNSFFAIIDCSKYCDISSYSTSGADASSLLQTCIDATDSGDTLTIPVGLFSLSTGIVINRSITIVSEAFAEPCSLDNPAACPILQASPDFYHPSAIVTVFNTSNVWLERIVIDGNRANRLRSTAAEECSNDVNNRDAGRNMFFNNCVNCKVGNSVVANSLCASSLVYIGAYATVYNTIFEYNGDNFSKLMWSDGLTCLSCDYGSFTGNIFIGNSDIDLIFGSGKGNMVVNNRFIHDSNRPIFGALMLDNFNGGTSGDFSGLILDSNSIDCGSGNCCFGIELGPHPWYQSAPISGGFLVRNNTIKGAGVGINLDAAGLPSSAVSLESNSISGTQKTFTCSWLCAAEQQGSNINVSPDSTAAYSADNRPTSSRTYKCAQ